MSLPLTAFEKYMFFDDKPEYPMDSFRLLRFSGTLDVNVFTESVEAAVAVHPLLRSIIKKTSRRNYVWYETQQSVSIRNVDELIPERLRITAAPGFRVYIKREQANVSILFQFHHSVSDGLGEMEFLGDVLTDYALRITGKTPPPPQRDASLLPLRGRSGLTLKSYVKNFFNTMFTTNQLVFGKADPLKAVAKNPAAVRDYFAFVTAELSPQQTKQCFGEAKKRGVTVNDYHLAALFSAMYDWRKSLPEMDFYNENPLYRVSVPVNLRTEQHKNIPASNTVTMLFLDRRLRQCADKEQLLKSIKREMDWAKRAEQKHYLLMALRIRDYLPGGIALMLKPRICRSTAVLSNLGRVFANVPLPQQDDGKLVVGKAVLEEVAASPPIRFGTLISFSMLTYADRLCYILRYDSQNMTKAQAEDFLQRFSVLLKKNEAC
ncbi:MAG: WS/DGAT domain-containing protein [Planctomycetaceae bacterium]|nr:WS/DGAT domain-containing protein [Planctomycetaceae bacterium]